ncbi:fatty acyl-CoA reductase 1-like [Apostichopus japonicus]|uniref:fatty acyl-CoA reductase 1-like n=1 Tax=Stichopus japonicus TaxID=307972 RepID=UPI003AB433AB
MQSESSRDLRSHSFSSTASSLNRTPRNSLENETTVLPSFSHDKYLQEQFVEPQCGLSLGPSNEPDVASFFAGKSVFITGATGFVGKVLVEKLLRSCSDVDKIFILVRPKRGVDPVTRIQKEFGNCELFRRVQRFNPDYVRKIIPIHGDMTKADLGISGSDVRLIQDDVSIVFHVAATVRFDEKLKSALQLNVIAAKYLMKIARGMKNLQSYQHISTAYAHCDQSYIDEMLYPTPANADQLHSSIEWMTDDMVSKITPSILNKKPNTYTFTKAMAEHMVITEGVGLPINIVRPSIVGATWKEPFPGWIDNHHGASGLMIAYGKGMLPSVLGDVNATFDLVPVDVVVNNMIAAAWYTAVKRPIKVPIYNCVSSTSNPLKFQPFASTVVNYYNKSPLKMKLRKPSGLRITKHDQIFNWSHFFHCKLPTTVFDRCLKLVGRKQRLSKMADLVSKSVYTLKYFTCNEWQWRTDNVTSLQNALPGKDKMAFSTELESLNWTSYINDFCAGTKEYVLKENVSEYGTHKSHVTRSNILRRFILASLVPLILWLTLKRTNFAKNLWFAVKLIVTYYTAVVYSKIPC